MVLRDPIQSHPQDIPDMIHELEYYTCKESKIPRIGLCVIQPILYIYINVSRDCLCIPCSKSRLSFQMGPFGSGLEALTWPCFATMRSFTACAPEAAKHKTCNIGVILSSKSFYVSRVDETVVEALGYKMNAQHGVTVPWDKHTGTA